MSNGTPRGLANDTEQVATPAQDLENMQDDEDTSAGLGLRHTVGDELRMRRGELGITIGDAVDAVRIQKRYLEALEEGRTDDLPGTVYALGFVRTYSNFLGLDGADMVARYKEETQSYKVDADLVLPEPIDEGKVPKMAIILVAVLLAAAAYGVWYFVTQRDTGVVAGVPDVPDRLAGLIEQETPAAAPAAPAPPPRPDAPTTNAPPLKTTAPAAPQPAAPAAPEPAAPAAPEPVAPPAPVSPEPAPAAVPAPVAVAPAAPAPDSSPAVEAPAATPVETAPSEPAPQAPPESLPEAAESMPSVSTPVAEAPPVSETPQPPEAEMPLALSTPVPGAEAPPSAPLEEVAREPRVFGASSDARIVIRALEDSWIEVTDVDGALLFSRVLRKGDSYRASNRQGSTLVTGNAGGLEVLVDGQLAPALGPAGVVRRNIRLDPDLLKAGTAIP